MKLESLKELLQNLPEQFPSGSFPQSREEIPLGRHRDERNAYIYANDTGPSIQSNSVTERLVQAATLELMTTSLEEVQRRYGASIAAEATEQARAVVPNTRQAMLKYRRREREASAELWKSLKANGVQIRQCSEQDYISVILLQLEKMLQGELPSAANVCELAFPDAPEKAKHLANSRNHRRWGKAYRSDAVRNHPLEQAMQAHHGARTMNQRCPVHTFRNSLSITRTLFIAYDKINKQEAQIRSLEHQLKRTNLSKTFADSDAVSLKDKALAMYCTGSSPKVIAEELGVKYNTLKTWLRRGRHKSLAE